MRYEPNRNLFPLNDGPAILAVDRVEAQVASHDWAWAKAAEERISAHWRRAKDAKPALFDGPVMMMMSGEARAGLYRAAFFETSFSRYLAWRDFGRPDPSVRNGFSMAALRASDGAWLLGVMGNHTSNAGQVYFPSGTPDPDDVVDGMVDLGGSVLRELEEETGLRPSDVTVEDVWHVVEYGARTAFLRPVRFDAPPEEAVALVEAHLAAEAEPELSGIRIVRRKADLDPAVMPDFLVHWFTTVLDE